MVNEHVKGFVTDIDEMGNLHIIASAPDIGRALKREYEECEIILADGRRISPEQRRKVYALIGEIADYCEGMRNAAAIEETKQALKWDFLLERMESQERRLFSLSSCDMTTAREFINYLVDFIVKNDIPTAAPLIDNCEDIGRYIYACSVNKRCAVCGKKAQWHHAEDRVGMGRNRKEICHIGLRGMPLCAKHHDLCHTMAQNEFNEKYHIQSIKVDEKIAKTYRLKKE